MFCRLIQWIHSMHGPSIWASICRRSCVYSYEGDDNLPRFQSGLVGVYKPIIEAEMRRRRETGLRQEVQTLLRPLTPQAAFLALFGGILTEYLRG